MKPPPANALVNQMVAHTLGLLVFGGSLGLGAVWVRQEIFSTANRNHQLELKIADAQRRLDELDAGIAAALNPQTLALRNGTMGLGLIAPRELQVVRVGESPELRLAAKRNQEIFTVQTASLNPEAPAGPAEAGTAAAPLSFRVLAAAYR